MKFLKKQFSERFRIRIGAQFLEHSVENIEKGQTGLPNQKKCVIRQPVGSLVSMPFRKFSTFLFTNSGADLSS